MKKMMALAIVFVFAGATRSWALAGLGDLKFDGSLEVTGVSINNEADTDKDSKDQRGDTGTRVRLGANAQITDGVTGRVEVTRDPGVGANAYYGGNQGTDLNTFQSEVRINNAYIALDNIFGIAAKLGRQYVGEAGDLAWHIGPKSNDAMTVNSISGLDLRRGFGDKVNVDLFTGKATETSGGANAGTTGDANLNNVNVGVMNVLPGGTINLGWQKGVNDTVPNAKARLQVWRVGVKGGVSENMVTYRAEYLKNAGEAGFGGANTKFKGSAIDLGAGLNLKETSAGKVSVGVNYAMASGDDSADTDDKSFHDLSFVSPFNVSDRYFGEIFGKDAAFNSGAAAGGQGLNQGAQGLGLKILNVGVKYVPPVLDGKLGAMVDMYVLKTDKKTAASNNSSKIGNEWDLALNYAHSSNVGIEAGYAMLTSVGDAIRLTNHDKITKLYSRVAVKWGGEEK